MVVVVILVVVDLARHLLLQIHLVHLLLALAVHLHQNLVARLHRHRHLEHLHRHRHLEHRLLRLARPQVLNYQS